MKPVAGLCFIFLIVNVSDIFAFAKKPNPALQSLRAGKKYMCPMRCYVSDKPGKCSKCGMELWEAA